MKKTRFLCRGAVLSLIATAGEVKSNYQYNENENRKKQMSCPHSVLFGVNLEPLCPHQMYSEALCTTPLLANS